MKFLFKYFLIWLPMIPIAIINGAARDLWYSNTIGELLARQISTLSFVVLLGFYIWFVLKNYPPRTVQRSISIGILWLFFTLLFEFGLGFAGGKSLSDMLYDYNIFQGRIWVLVPIFVAIAPYLFYTMRIRR